MLFANESPLQIATPTPTNTPLLFVGDLSSICREEHLRELFTCHGYTVVDVQMMGWKISSNSYDYAFVELASQAEAAVALTAMNGVVFEGRQLRVRWAQPNVKSHKNSSVNSVHVRFKALKVLTHSFFLFLNFCILHFEFFKNNNIALYILLLII